MDKILQTIDNIGIKLSVLAELKEHYLCVSFVILLFSEAVYCSLTLDNIGIKVFVLAELKEH